MTVVWRRGEEASYDFSVQTYRICFEARPHRINRFDLGPVLVLLGPVSTAQPSEVPCLQSSLVERRGMLLWLALATWMCFSHHGSSSIDHQSSFLAGQISSLELSILLCAQCSARRRIHSSVLTCSGKFRFDMQNLKSSHFAEQSLEVP